MIILVKAVMIMMISFLISMVVAVILIPFLKKRANQKLSIYLEEKHRDKKNTPTFGGIIFIVPVVITFIFLYLFNKINISYTLLIMFVAFLGYALIGFIDDILIVKKNNNKGLSEAQKLLMQLVIAIVFFYLFMLAGNEPLLWIHTINLKVNIGWFYGLFILLVLLSSSNAVNLTDGLDGLATGLSIIAVFTFGVIAFNTGWLEGYEEVGLLCFSLVGSLLGFLLFNVNPAKIFMGDTGSLALGAFLGSIAILTRHEILLIVIGIVFVIETLSCVIQRFYYKRTKRRLFLMTPIHHTFEKMGWNERDIVKLFWTIGLIASMIAISFGVIV